MRKALDIILIEPQSEEAALAGEIMREPATEVFGDIAGNPLNPFSWFSGDAQKTIDNADKGILDPSINTNSLTGKMLERKARQAEMMKLLGR